jgi:hypothetical protein
METRKRRFALSGSSARKLRRRSGSNLLAGRAITRHLAPFAHAELGDRYAPDLAIQWGSLPLVVQAPEHAADTLNAYLNTYLREEVREESLVRQLAPFARFLAVAGLLNGQAVNGQNIAREAAVSRSSVDNYFAILEDTLVGQFLPAYRPHVKVRERAQPKFYWFDPGVARAAAGLLFDPVDWLRFAMLPISGSALPPLVHDGVELVEVVAATEAGGRRLLHRARSGDDVVDRQLALTGQFKHLQPVAEGAVARQYRPYFSTNSATRRTRARSP